VCRCLIDSWPEIQVWTCMKIGVCWCIPGAKLLKFFKNAPTKQKLLKSASHHIIPLLTRLLISYIFFSLSVLNLFSRNSTWHSAEPLNVLYLISLQGDQAIILLAHFPSPGSLVLCCQLHRNSTYFPLLFLRAPIFKLFTTISLFCLWIPSGF
jgi:hypothetical protein